MFVSHTRILSALCPALLLLSCSGRPQLEIVPPEGFRAIAESEHSADWRQAAYLFPTPDRAEGDFDGDGKLDHARIWIHESGDGWVLMAYLSSIPDTPQKLAESDRPPRRRPIRTIAAGEHRTHQYYGIGPGGPDTTAVVRLVYDAINLGYTESEGITYVWNPERQAFDAVGMY